MLRGERKITCPHCGQSLPFIRLSVRIGPIKARIFDALQRAGPDGIEAELLFDLIYRGRPVQRSTLKSQICQLSDVMRDAGVRFSGRGGIYRMVSISRRRAA